MGAETIFEAENGANALEVLKREKIDLVICDWNMPSMSGVVLLERVRNDERFADMPFIMVTAEGKKDNILEATRRGVTGYVTKPFGAEALRSKIKAMFGNGHGENK